LLHPFIQEICVVRNPGVMSAVRQCGGLPTADCQPPSAVGSAFPPGKPGQSTTRPKCVRRAIMIIIEGQKTNIVVSLTDFTRIAGNREF